MGPELVVGDEGNDSILGGEGDDLLDGDDGNDVIEGEGGDDIIGGGTGNDTLRGGGGRDWIVGDSGDDYIDGGLGNDDIFAGDGDDTAKGGDGDDLLFGGSGDDYLLGESGDDFIDGGDGLGDVAAYGGARDQYSVEFNVDGLLEVRDLVEDRNGNDIVKNVETLLFEDGNELLVSDLPGSPRSAPSDLHLSANSFDENIAAGSVVATLSTTDTDVVDSFAYELVSGVGDADNTAFVIIDDQLKIVESPDYESKKSYRIRLRTEDSDGLLFEREFNLDVNDIDELPSPTTSPMDFTGDGIVDSTDALLMMRHMMGTFPGDVITQGIPNTHDVDGLHQRIMSNMEQVNTLGGGYRMDIDGDGIINPLSDGLAITHYIHAKGIPGGISQMPDVFQNPIRGFDEMQNHLKDLVGF